MTSLKYYRTESEEFSEAFDRTMTDTEAKYIYKRLKARYKLAQTLTLTNAVRGRCSRWEVKLEHKPSIGVMAHEVAHGIQYRKHHAGQKWHCKKHRSLMIKVLKVIEKNFLEWRNMANKKADRKVNTLKNKLDRQASLKERKKTIEYKLAHTKGLIKKWNTKKKMADNKLKKLNRRRKLYENRIGGRNPPPYSFYSKNEGYHQQETGEKPASTH